MAASGYCMVNDVSERDWQLRWGGQWGKGKSFDSFMPVGPWLVTPEDLGNPQAVSLNLSVNEGTMRRGNSADMIFDIDTLISYVSGFTTSEPGDLIITGTPAGVGAGMRPERFLKAGDQVEMTADRLGTRRHRVDASIEGAHTWSRSL
jgi:ureidoglycolate lyase